MSDNHSDWLGKIMHPDDVPHAAYSSIAPDWSGNMYAPISYNPGESAYTHVPTEMGTGDHAAQDLNAKIIRAQYDDYERRFQPLEDLAVGLLTKDGTKDLPYDLNRTRATVGGVFNSLQGQQERAMERFGQTSKADNITGSNAEAGAMVGGLNNAVLSDEARRMKLLGGGTSTASGAIASATGG